MKLKARREGRVWACFLFQFQLLLCFYKIDPTNRSFCHKKIPDGAQGQESLYKLVVGSEGFRWEEEAQRSGTLGLRPKQRCYLVFPHSASSLLTPPPSSIDKGRLTLKATVWPEGGGVSAPATEHLTSGLLPWPVALLLAADSFLFLVS